MDTLHMDGLPVLRDPLFVMAFAGWNDASEAATDAVRFLVRKLNGKRFAWIHSDPYFQYTDQRPQVRLDAEGNRQIHWPSNEFYYCVSPELKRDLIVGIGVEPHINWRRFSRDVLKVIHRSRVQMSVTLGAFLGGDLHTEPIHLIGLATEPALGERLNVEMTRYEGPTGIVGVVHSLLQDEGHPAVSLWANVPHYIGGISNPKATLALLQCFSRFTEVSLDLGGMERSAGRFNDQVESMIAQNPQIASLFSDAQSGNDFSGEMEDDDDDADDAPAVEGELPPGREMADEIERLFRRRRGGEDSEK
ncbi:MAG: PAC2 family protein [bacterium]|nr:PAC2 family protein [bacterium]